jgi:hypothetical protein
VPDAIRNFVPRIGAGNRVPIRSTRR